MTEKRFELKSWSYNHLKAKVYDNLKKEELYLSLYEIVDLLNEVSQSEYDLAKENRKLKDENEQLKQQLDSIYKSYSDYYGMNIRNAEWYGFKGDVE